MKKTITLYGAGWCADCKRSRAFLDQSNIQYKYINIEEDEKAADKVVELNKGLRSIPTILFPNGSILTEPSNNELKKELIKNKLINN